MVVTFYTLYMYIAALFVTKPYCLLPFMTDFNNLSLSGFQEPEAQWANNECNDEMFHNI